MKYKKLRYSSATLALTGTLLCTNAITVNAVEVTPGTQYGNSIAIIVSEEGKQDRVNRDYRVPELPVELLREGQVVSKDTSDEMGVAIFDNVEPGEYEIKVPQEYKGLTLAEGTVEGKLSIDKDKQEAIHVSYKGVVSKQARAPEDNYDGKLKIKVVDNKGKAIPGAEVIVQGVSNTNYQTSFVADSKGEISVINMKPGEYALKQSEKSTKDRGYEVEKSVYNVNVSPSSGTVIIENKVVGNFIKPEDIPKADLTSNKPKVKEKANNEERKPGDVVIQVVNPSKQEKITGIEVPIYKQGTNETVKTLKTDKYGAIEVKGLQPGIYEYKKPNSEQRVKFNVANYDALFTLGEKAQEQRKSEVAKTRTMIGLYVAGAVTIISLAVVLLRKFKRNKRGY
ncbi:hypothetical protein UT300012_22960 [Paraclostridium bifermentans]